VNEGIGKGLFSSGKKLHNVLTINLTIGWLMVIMMANA
jgi:hypothetical protein